MGSTQNAFFGVVSTFVLFECFCESACKRLSAQTCRIFWKSIKHLYQHCMTSCPGVQHHTLNLGNTAIHMQHCGEQASELNAQPYFFAPVKDVQICTWYRRLWFPAACDQLWYSESENQRCSHPECYVGKRHMRSCSVCLVQYLIVYW